MSEDTAHGQFFEPAPVTPGPQVQQAGITLEQALDQQVRRIQQLAVRVDSLIAAAQDAFQEFTMETAILFETLQSLANEIEERHANRPTNPTTTQTST